MSQRTSLCNLHRTRPARSARAAAALAALVALAVASPVGATVILGARSAQFSWQSAPGEVEFYEVWVSRSTRGGGFALEQTVVGSTTSAVIDAEVGELVSIRVRAGNDKQHGPMSEPSETVRFGLPPQYPVVGMPGVVSGRAAGSETAAVYFADESTGVTWRYARSEPEQAPSQIGIEPDDRWKLVASGDFDGDGNEDLFWHHENGATRIWYLDGAGYEEELSASSPGTDWTAELTTDFDGNGQDDVFWRAPDGATVAWLRAGVDFALFYFPAMAPETWELLTAGDFDGDGFSDLFWRHRQETHTSIWFVQSDPDYGVYARTRGSNEQSLGWEVAETRDEDGDGMDDLLWRRVDTPERVEWWHMDGETVRPPQVAAAP